MTDMLSQEFKQILEGFAAEVNDFLSRQLSQKEESGIGRLAEACRYSTLSGGKRIRAALAMMVARAYKRNFSAALKFAAAIELIHAYSLIHDDLPAMDNDDFRRGKPTNHKVFGEAMAILAGDNLLTTAFAWLAGLAEDDVPPAVVVELVALVAEAAGLQGMIGGQALDIASENIKISCEELERIHRLKTGALLTVPLVGAAKICCAPESDSRILTGYAQKIGLLFQIVDDILDVEGDLENLGKTPGSDVKKGKATYPSILGLEKTRELAAQTHAEALLLLKNFSADQTLLAQMADFIYSRKN